MRSAYKNWLWQRFTAIILMIYFLTLFFIIESGPSYNIWLLIMQMPIMQSMTLAALFSIVWHSWHGMHGVFLDYIKLPLLRMVLSITLVIGYVFCLSWGIITIWGVS